MKPGPAGKKGFFARYSALAARVLSPFAKLLRKARSGFGLLAGKGARRVVVLAVSGLVLAASLAFALFVLPAPKTAARALEAKPEEYGVLMPVVDESEPEYQGPLGEGGVNVIGEDEAVYDGEGMHGDEWGGDGDGEYWEYSAVRTVLIPPARRNDPIRIRFSADVGSPSSARSAFPDPQSEVGVEFDPPLKGEYEWMSARELRIYPAPGSLRIGQSVSYRIFSRGGRGFIPGDEGSFAASGSYGGDDKGGDSRALAGEFAAGEFKGQAIEAGKPMAVAILDASSGLIAADGAYVLFDQPVKPEDLRATATKNGKKAAVSLEAVDSLPMDPDGLVDPEYVLFARFAAEAPARAQVAFSFVPKSVSPKAPAETLSGYTSRVEAVVAPPLSWRIEELEDGNKPEYLDLSRDFRIDFTGPVSLESVRQAVSLQSFGKSESAGNASFYSENGESVMVSLSLSYGGEYGLSISQGFTDELGRGFEKEQPAYEFRARDKKPELYVPATALVLEEGQDRLPLRFMNPGPITLEIERFADAADYIRALGGSHSGDTVKVKEIRADTSEGGEDPYRNAVYRSEIGIDGAPGLKLVKVSIEGSGSEAPFPIAKSVLVQTTGIALSAKVWSGKVMAWAVDMGRAKPLAGIRTALYAGSGMLIAEGKTDADGAAVMDFPADSPLGDSGILYLSAEKGKDVAIVRLSDDDLSKAWQFNLPSSDGSPGILPAALFTERGAYRPGETVNFKAFIRPGEGEKPGFVAFSVKDPRGSEILNAAKELDSFWGADGSLALGPNADTGEYVIRAEAGGSTRSCSFRVEEYKLPTFAVKVASPTGIVAGARASATVSAEYLRGGALDGRDVEWRVYRQPEMYRDPSYPDYVFGLYPDAAMTGTVARGEGKLDDSGRTSLEFVPDYPSEQGQMRYIVEASVQDVDRQVFAGRYSQLVDSGGLRVGMRPLRQALFPMGQVLRLPFVVLDRNGKPAAGKDVIVQLNKIDYYTSTMEGLDGSTQTYNHQVVAEQTLGKVVSGPGPKELSVRISDTGTWQLKLLAKDDRGRTAAAEFLFSSYGDAATAWPRFDRERIELIADKEEYAVGETIRVMAQNPYKSTIGLLTAETDGVISRKVVRSSGDNPAFEIPVTEEMAPNAYVSLVLVRPREHSESDGTGFQTGAPGYKVGYAKVKVVPTGKKLSVAVSDARASASAGQEYSFTVSARDAKGAPAEASACVMVVDEAALSLTGYRTPDPIAMAYVARKLGVRNGSNVLDMPHSRRIRNDELFPGGDSDIDALIEASQRQEKRDLVRKLFKSTAYWNPSVELGPGGQAKLSFVLPDNLTSYRVMVVAVDKKGAMGSGQASFACRKALSIQPALPRFAYAGDKFSLDVVAANGSGADGEVRLAPRLEGLLAANGQASSKALKNGEEAVFSFPVTASNAKSATVRLSADMGAERDSVELTLPIRRMETRLRKSASGFLDANGSLTVKLGASPLPGSLSVEATVGTTPLSSLKDALHYLLEYPHGCIEQTSSRAYPLVVLSELIPLFGAEVDTEELAKMARAGIARVQTFATASGGLSFWPGGNEPHAYGSTVGLNILCEARKRGYAVDEKTYAKLLDWVDGAAKGRSEAEPGAQAFMDDDVRAYALFVLSQAERPEPGLVESMWREAPRLSPFAKASLAMAAASMPQAKGLASEILKDLRARQAAALKDIEAGKSARGEWSMGSSVRDAAALAMAFFAVDPKAPEVGVLAEKLLELQARSQWYSTQDNVFGIMALCRIFGAPGAAKPGQGAVIVNGKSFPFSALQDMPGGGIIRLTEKELGRAEGRLTLRLDLPGDGRRYASLRATWLVSAEDKSVSRQSDGYALERIYETKEGKSLKGRVLPLGELVRIRLKLRASKEKTYFALTDYLPAGLEPVNAALATTGSSDAEGETSAEARSALPLISYRDVRDWGVSFYADRLPAGSYEFVYYARATTAGEFQHPQAVAEAMYEPYFRGSTEPGRVTVR